MIAQIEDPEAMDELDAIAAVEGIDMLFFGPGDFTHALGLLGETDKPEVDAARIRVAEAAQKHGKWAGTVGSVDAVASLVEMGYGFVSVGADVVAMLDSFTDICRRLGRGRSADGASVYAARGSS